MYLNGNSKRELLNFETIMLISNVYSYFEINFQCRSDGNRRHYSHIRMRNPSSKYSNWYMICSKHKITVVSFIYQVKIFFSEQIYVHICVFLRSEAHIYAELKHISLHFSTSHFIFLCHNQIPCIIMESGMQFHWYFRIRTEGRAFVIVLTYSKWWQISIRFETFLFHLQPSLQFRFRIYHRWSNLKKKIVHSSNVRWHCIYVRIKLNIIFLGTCD